MGPEQVLAAMDAFETRLPLPALLSMALVAYAIEWDSEFEHRIPHRTTVDKSPRRDGVWLTSMAMWFNCLRHLPADGITVVELFRLVRMPTNYDGMRRWGYVTIEGAQSPVNDRSRLIPRRVGLAAAECGRSIFPLIDGRWNERFGAEDVLELRAALEALMPVLDPALPDYMPMVGYGFSTTHPLSKMEKAGEHLPLEEPAHLPTLLAKPLLAFALEFERSCQGSMALHSDALRILSPDGVTAAAMAERAGIAKNAVDLAAGYLVKQGLADQATEGTKRVVRITEAGVQTRQAGERRIAAIEEDWRSKFGGATIDRLRSVLERVVGDGRDESPLLSGLTPHPEGWRAQLPARQTLPHFPLVTHRGGYPDGS